MSASDNEAQTLAELRAKVEKEPISRFLDIKLVELATGYAKVTMKTRPEYRTFNGFTFGGIVMCVADQAFACATNSMGRASVATQFNIHFIAGSDQEDELTAECRVIRKGRRVDIAEITVNNRTGKLIAKASGTTIPLT
ncbi:MAG: PaaI family thioesterase [Chloroflexi bacterium]|nr:PaaI family thioesterase [Chloroflexota bacterium]